MRVSIKNKVKISGVDIDNTSLSTNGTSDSIKKTWVDQLMLFIKVGGMASGNITFVVQSSYDNVNWFDHTAGSAISGPTNQLITETNVGPYVRIKWTITGGGSTGTTLTLITKGGK
jgi:hypothetical protein